MGYVLQLRTLVVMSTAALAAIWDIAYAQHNFFAGVFFLVLYFGETLFHEMGHTVFYWLFGSAAIPSIMTLIGADKAGGATLVLGHFRGVQLLAYAAMAGGCYYCYRSRPLLFYPALIFTVGMSLLSFTHAAKILPVYMGQGGSILAAGVLLYRAWLDVGVHSLTERWLNALYGFFIVLHNAWFAQQLMHATAERARYENSELTNDFVVLTHLVSGWQLSGIALFTLMLCVLVLLASFAAAAYFAESEQQDVGF